MKKCDDLRLPRRPFRTESGSALVVVMIFTAVFATVIVSYLAGANASLQAAKMEAESRKAQVAAESGVAFVRQVLPEIDVSEATTMQETLVTLAAGLNARFQDTLFAGDTATVDGNDVLLPPVILNFPEGPSQFQVRIVGIDNNRYRVRSVGGFGQCDKAVNVDFVAAGDDTFIARFGVASRSKISMTGNTRIVGANHPEEGSVLSTTMTSTQAITMMGNINISGDVSVVNPEGTVKMTGNASIGGEIQIGVDNPQFPTINTDPYYPLATNIVNSSTKTSGNCSFENIRIVAGTNPTFSGNTTIRGVVYIESPNKVTFTGNLDIIGVIVTEGPGGTLDLNNNYLRFTGNTSTNGVSALPDTDQFRALKELDGSFLLAPGFEVNFTGNFSTINGTIAASKFKFTGNASGTVHGSVLNLDDTDFVMSGNSSLIIDHDGANMNPAGLEFPRTVTYVPGSYSE